MSTLISDKKLRIEWYFGGIIQQFTIGFLSYLIKNKKAAPNVGAAFRFYPHHFKTDDRAAVES
jgi:hypothetical protein